MLFSEDRVGFGLTNTVHPGDTRKISLQQPDGDFSYIDNSTFRRTEPETEEVCNEKEKFMQVNINLVQLAMHP